MSRYLLEVTVWILFYLLKHDVVLEELQSVSVQNLAGPSVSRFQTICGLPKGTYVQPPDEELNNRVKSWWRTEDFGCKYEVEAQRSVEDEKAMHTLEESTKLVDGRYEVPLLWKKNCESLENNRAVAEHRLVLLEKRLQRDINLAEAYKESIHGDLQKDYIKKLGPEEVDIEEK